MQNDERRQVMNNFADYYASKNPDVAEELGQALARSARREKAAGGGVLGMALFIGTNGVLEMRAGNLNAYIEGEAPGRSYTESLTPLGG